MARLDALILIYVFWFMFYLHHFLIYPFLKAHLKNHLVQRDYCMIIDKREVMYLKDILLTAYNLKQIFRYKI